MNTKAVDVREGCEELWRVFGLSYASWLVLPRMFMHAMPDDWQGRMAKLVEEFNATFDPWRDCDEVIVSFKRDGKFIPLPHWSGRHHYRHPNQQLIDSMRAACQPSNEATTDKSG